jgi:pumilio homology domain family member 6
VASPMELRQLVSGGGGGGSTSSGSGLAHNAIHLLASRAGTRALSYFIAYATAKDRKAMLKSIKGTWFLLLLLLTSLCVVAIDIARVECFIDVVCASQVNSNDVICDATTPSFFPYKGYARSGLLHKDAYLAIIRLVQLTDDTVVVQKNLLQELITTPTKNSKDNVIIVNKKKKQMQEEPTEQQQQDSPLLEICTSETGSKLFLMLLPNPEQSSSGNVTGGAAAAATTTTTTTTTTAAPAWRKYFDPYELSVLFENPTIGNEPTSKKSPTIKRQELLDNCLRDPLVQLCCQHTEELLRSRPGCAVLREVYHDVVAVSSFSSSQTAAAAAAVERIGRAVVDVCVASLKGSDSGADEENENNEDAAVAAPMPLLEDRIGHLAIKNLLLFDAAFTTTTTTKSDNEKNDNTTTTTESPSTPLLFATQFLDRLGECLMDIAQANRGAFVVAALCKVPSVRKSAIAKLDRKRLEELSKQENVPTAGFVALLKEINSSQ